MSVGCSCTTTDVGCWRTTLGSQFSVSSRWPWELNRSHTGLVTNALLAEP